MLAGTVASDTHLTVQDGFEEFVSSRYRPTLLAAGSCGLRTAPTKECCARRLWPRLVSEGDDTPRSIPGYNPGLTTLRSLSPRYQFVSRLPLGSPHRDSGSRSHLFPRRWLDATHLAPQEGLEPSTYWLTASRAASCATADRYARKGSNLRPAVCGTAALPTELLARGPRPRSRARRGRVTAG